MRTFSAIDELLTAVGEELGSSEWLEIDQERVNRFADATGDHQWIHVDPERAKEGPFGTTIAHGYLTLSLLPQLMRQIYRVDGVRMGINYGLNKVRFPAPVPVGSRVRATAALSEAKAVTGGVQAEATVTIEIEGSDKPACVAVNVVRYYG
ncbi:MAG: MaoC family dehydratase [Haloechinothrix sp.]